MLGIFSKVIGTATRQDVWGPHRDVSPHDTMLNEPERRKGRELRRQSDHAKRSRASWGAR